MSQHVARAYGAVADRYIELFADISSVHHDDVSFIERHLRHTGGRVIDIGCGPGHLTAHLRSIGVDAGGIDPVPAFVDYATATHSGCQFKVATVHDLAAGEIVASGLLLWYSLIHVPPAEMDETFAMIAEIVEPGGKLVIGHFDGPAVEPFDHRVAPAYFWPADELSSRLRAVGLLEVERLTRPGDGEVRAHACLAAKRAKH